MASDSQVGLPAAYQTLHTGIVLYEADSGTILAANDRAEALFGYPTRRLQTLSIDRYTANASQFSAAEFVDHLQASADGRPREFRWRIKRSDGELVWVQVSLSPATVDGQQCVRAELRDVTEYYNSSHREELFWRVLRHNLRNEANALVGYSEQVSHLGVTPAVQDAAEVIKEKAMALGEITESVKQIQHAVDQTEDQRERHDAETLVRETLSEFEETGAELSVVEREQMWVEVDTALEYALSQAVENALVHHDRDNPTATVHIGPSPNTGRVEIRIEDDNAPIPEAELDSLFDRDAVTATSHGSGVGLFAMKWCIESLGGEIRVERGDPRGNIVYFYLPPKPAPTDRTGTF